MGQQLYNPNCEDRGEVWSVFRNDRELLQRLKVTPEELDALDNCSLLGAITCKQDLLFILQQIREATESPAEEQSGASEASPVKRLGKVKDSEDRKCKRANTRMVARARQSSSFARLVQRRNTEQLLVLALAISIAVSLVSVLFVGFHAVTQRMNANSAMGFSSLSSPAVARILGPNEELKTLIVTEGVVVMLFLVIFGYARWNALQRFRTRPGKSSPDTFPPTKRRLKAARHSGV